MIRFLLATLLFAFCVPSLAVVVAKQNNEPTQPPLSLNNLDTPQPKKLDSPGLSLSEWYQQHSAHVSAAQASKTDAVVIGSSIAALWHSNPQQTALFNNHFHSIETVNFAIPDDRLQNILWRLQQGLNGNLNPKIVIAQLGEVDIAQGDITQQQYSTLLEGIITQLQSNYPNATVILSGVPININHNQLAPNTTVEQANKILAKFANGKNILFFAHDYPLAFLPQKEDLPLATELSEEQEEDLDQYFQLLSAKIDFALNQKDRLSQWVKVTNPNISIMGRHAQDHQGKVTIGYPGVTINLRMNAKKISLFAQSNKETYFDVFLDGAFFHTIKIPTSATKIPLYEALTAAPHQLSLVNRAETWQGITQIMGFEIREGELLTADDLPARKILVIGDSITCGEGAGRPNTVELTSQCEKNPLWWRASNTYGMQLGELLDAQVQLVCYGGRGLVRSWNGRTDELTIPQVYGLSVPTEDTQSHWDQAQFEADLIISMIGTNDFSSSAGPPPKKRAFTTAYLDFVSTLTKDHPQAHIILTDGPIVNDRDRPLKSTLLDYLYSTQAKAKNHRVHVIPSRPYSEDNCDMHPPGAFHLQMAKDLEPLVKNILDW